MTLDKCIMNVIFNFHVNCQFYKRINNQLEDISIPSESIPYYVYPPLGFQFCRSSASEESESGEDDEDVGKKLSLELPEWSLGLC